MPENTVMASIDSLRPYKKNPRDNSKSIGKVAESIKAFGFLQPIVCDADGVILAGHTRYAAAKQLGLKEVPVLYAKNLTPAQAKAYRLADNKVGEESKWISDLLVEELETISADDIMFDATTFGFAEPRDIRLYKGWENAKKLCNLDKKIMLRAKGGFFYTSFFSASKHGRLIEEIKEDPALVEPFAYSLCDYVHSSLGKAFDTAGWCLCTTPRRRHKEGFHFATAICEVAARELGIPFHPDIIVSHNRDRIHTDFELVQDPPQRNIILFDDIITTGITIRDTRQLLVDTGHIVYTVVAIRNQ